MSYRLELEPDDLRGADGAVAARRWGMILLLAAMVMAGSAAGLWAAWRVIGHHSTGAVPILHADERPVKVPPANPGGMEVPDQDMYILNRDRPVDSRVEQLLPPPETPLPRPTPAEPATTISPPTAPATAPAAAPAAEPVTAPAVAPATSQPPAAPAAVASPPPAVAVVAPPAAAPPPAAATGPARVAPPAAPAASGPGYRLQLGAVRSAEAAQQEWTRLKREQAEILGGLTAEARRVDLGARGVYYRIVAGPRGDAAAAEHACDELKRHKVGCLLVKP